MYCTIWTRSDRDMLAQFRRLKLLLIKFFRSCHVCKKSLSCLSCYLSSCIKSLVVRGHRNLNKIVAVHVLFQRVSREFEAFVLQPIFLPKPCPYFLMSVPQVYNDVTPITIP